MKNKLKTLIWFIKNKDRRIQAWHVFKLRLFPHPKENSKEASEKLCLQKGVNQENALVQITGQDKFIDVYHSFPDVINEAKKRCETSPVKMGGPANLNLLYHLADYCNAEKVIETGVAYGWSSLALLLSMHKRTSSKLVSIDMPYPKANNENYVGIAVPDNYKSHWTLIRKADRMGLPEAIEQLGTIDLCHYDSDKSYTGRMFAYPLLWNALRPGGIFISDDIQDNVAFFDFANRLSLPYKVISSGNKGVGIIVKKSS